MKHSRAFQPGCARALTRRTVRAQYFRLRRNAASSEQASSLALLDRVSRRLNVLVLQRAPANAQLNAHGRNAGCRLASERVRQKATRSFQPHAPCTKPRQQPQLRCAGYQVSCGAAAHEHCSSAKQLEKAAR